MVTLDSLPQEINCKIANINQDTMTQIYVIHLNPTELKDWCDTSQEGNLTSSTLAILRKAVLELL